MFAAVFFCLFVHPIITNYKKKILPNQYKRHVNSTLSTPFRNIKLLILSSKENSSLSHLTTQPTRVDSHLKDNEGESMNQYNLENAEERRLDELLSYEILDTSPENDFDNITELAASICDTKMAVISLVDKNRVWFKSRVNIEPNEVERQYAFCSENIINKDQPLVIGNAQCLAKYDNNPLVQEEPHFTFYAGVPLVTKNNIALGALCVLHDEPKQLTELQLSTLQKLASQVVRLLELRKSKRKLEAALCREKEVNHDLENFASVAAHDLKAPLANIHALAELLELEAKDRLNEDEIGYIGLIEKSSDQLRNMIDAMLSFTKSLKIDEQELGKVSAQEVYKSLDNIVNTEPNFKLNWKSEVDYFHVNKSALDQILLNLVTNAIKYNDKQNPMVSIQVSENRKEYIFEVEDNGMGISQEDQAKIFRVFETGNKLDKTGKKGTGMGLANVLKIVRKMGGEISVESVLGEGSTFRFTLKK